MSETEQGMAETIDDVSLINRYVQSGDREAMGILFQRHADSAYRTAVRVVGNPGDAEDAVQNAFIKVMQNAEKYRGGEGVRMWIMKTVIGTCKDRIRREVRRRKREELVTEQDEIGGSATGNEAVGELAASVMQLLDKLPEHYRMPIWLHHYEGLTTGEAAAALAIPENTLRSQINRGLQRLKNMLDAGGMAASAGSILAAMPVMPAEVAPESLVNSLSAMAQGVGPFSPAAMAAKATATGKSGLSVSHGLKVAATVAVVGTSVGVIGIMVANRKDAGALPQPALSSVSPSPAAVKGIFHRWDFNSPEVPAAFKVEVGSWHYVPNGGPDGSGCMQTDDLYFKAVIDVPLDALPVAATMKTSAFVNPAPEGDFMTRFFWIPSDNMAVFRGLSQHQVDTVVPGTVRGRWHEIREYVASTYSDLWTDNRHAGVTIATRRPESRLALYIRGKHRIDDLTIRSISPAELPDMSRYLDAVARIPPEKRVGTVVIPELKPGPHAKEVSVEFAAQK